MSLFLPALDEPDPYPRGDQWEKWRGRLHDPRHPPKFARARPRQVPEPEVQDSERSEICDAALWLMCNDSARRAYSENDVAASEWERVVRPLNFQNSKIVDLLSHFAAGRKIPTVKPRNTMAETVKYYWSDQAKFCEDIMLYLLRPDVYLASVYDWYNACMNTILDGDFGFGDQILFLVLEFLEGPTSDPIRELGFSMRATLPRHPLVTNAFEAIDRREAHLWADLLININVKGQFLMREWVGPNLVDRLRMLLEGAQLRYLTRGRDIPRERVVALGAVRDLVWGFAGGVENNMVTWDYDYLLLFPEEPPDALEEEMAPPDDGAGDRS